MEQLNERLRRWYQIHLSTALVGMVVAGTLLGLSLHSNYVLAWYHGSGGLKPEERIAALTAVVTLNLSLLSFVIGVFEMWVRLRNPRQIGCDGNSVMLADS